MRSEKRQARMTEIEVEAYKLFAQNGFESTSMLAVAKAAKASNETMYRWYGDKRGLFESMVVANAARAQSVLEAALVAGQPARDALAQIAPVLLGMLLSENAILLNRAAASDPSGQLGAVLAQAGREAVLPLISALVEQATKAGELHPPSDVLPAELFVHVLVGDRQIRRVIGTLKAPDTAEIAVLAARGLAQFEVLCSASR